MILLAERDPYAADFAEYFLRTEGYPAASFWKPTRSSDRVDRSDYGGRHERMSSGVPALDGMLADGYWRGAATVIAGLSGIGKTLLAMHFVFTGAAVGEKGLIATFQENPVQLERVIAGFSWTQPDPNIG